MPRRRILAAVAALAMVAAPAASGSPSAHAARSCNLAGKYQSLGPTYVETLDVRGVSCAAGERLVKAYYRCRVSAAGRSGHCRHAVLGYRCHERRSGISTQFVARVSCTRGRKAVTHRYSQNT
jgi:hypothetical protein